MVRSKPLPPLTLQPERYYRCPDCDELIPDQGNRCDNCGKFGSRVLVYLICPHCDEPISEDDLA